MADLSPQRSPWVVNLSDRSLVIEDEAAKLQQAQFSRLQMALGLKREIGNDDSEKYGYGNNMPALENDRPTALERKGNTTVCCISPVIYRGIGGWINTIVINAAKFHTAHLEDVSPRDYAVKVSDCSVTLSFKMPLCCPDNKMNEHEQDLGRARYLLDAFLGPLCIEENNATNLRHHEHTKHKECSARENIVFVLPNKHAVLRDLQALGCDLEKHLHTTDIFDLRELNQTYLVRYIANGLGPQTGGQRSEIPRSDRLSTVEEILKARECFSWDLEDRIPSRDILKAAVRMACKDATSAAWVRTKEQVDGGGFSYLRGSSSQDELFASLLQHDFAMSTLGSEQQLKYAVMCENKRLGMLPYAKKVAIMVNLAQWYNCTSLLLGKVRLPVETQTQQTIRLIRIAGKEMRPKPASPSTSATTGSASSASAAEKSRTRVTAPPTRNGLHKDQALPEDLVRVVATYREAGRDITRRLVAFLDSLMGSWPDLKKRQIRLLYSIEDGEYLWASCTSFERFAREARKSGWKMDDEVATWFITAITSRRKLRDWYDRLPSDDSRFEANDRHEAWLQTLIDVVFALAGHQY